MERINWAAKHLLDAYMMVKIPTTVQRENIDLEQKTQNRLIILYSRLSCNSLSIGSKMGHCSSLQSEIVLNSSLFLLLFVDSNNDSEKENI